MLPKEIKCTSAEILGASSDGRFLMLEGDKVHDTKINPVAHLNPLDPKGQFLVKWGDFTAIMTKNQVHSMFHTPEANFNFEEVEALIQKCQYIVEANLTICILTISEATAFCGVFNEVHTCGMTETEKEYAAYLNALKELTTYFIHRRNEQVNVLEGA